MFVAGEACASIMGCASIRTYSRIKNKCPKRKELNLFVKFSDRMQDTEAMPEPVSTMAHPVEMSEEPQPGVSMEDMPLSGEAEPTDEDALQTLRDWGGNSPEQQTAKPELDLHVEGKEIPVGRLVDIDDNEDTRLVTNVDVTGGNDADRTVLSNAFLANLMSAEHAEIQDRPHSIHESILRREPRVRFADEAEQEQEDPDAPESQMMRSRSLPVEHVPATEGELEELRKEKHRKWKESRSSCKPQDDSLQDDPGEDDDDDNGRKEYSRNKGYRYPADSSSQASSTANTNNHKVVPSGGNSSQGNTQEQDEEVSPNYEFPKVPVSDMKYSFVDPFSVSARYHPQSHTVRPRSQLGLWEDHNKPDWQVSDLAVWGESRPLEPHPPRTERYSPRGAGIGNQDGLQKPRRRRPQSAKTIRDIQKPDFAKARSKRPKSAKAGLDTAKNSRFGQDPSGCGQAGKSTRPTSGILRNAPGTFGNRASSRENGDSVAQQNVTAMRGCSYCGKPVSKTMDYLNGEFFNICDPCRQQTQSNGRQTDTQPSTSVPQQATVDLKKMQQMASNAKHPHEDERVLHDLCSDVVDEVIQELAEDGQEVGEETTAYNVVSERALHNFCTSVVNEVMVEIKEEDGESVLGEDMRPRESAAKFQTDQSQATEFKISQSETNDFQTDQSEVVDLNSNDPLPAGNDESPGLEKEELLSNLEDLEKSLDEVQNEIQECLRQSTDYSSNPAVVGHTSEEATYNKDMPPTQGQSEHVSPAAGELSSHLTGASNQNWRSTVSHTVTVYQFDSSKGADTSGDIENKSTHPAISTYDVTMMSEGGPLQEAFVRQENTFFQGLGTQLPTVGKVSTIITTGQ